MPHGYSRSKRVADLLKKEMAAMIMYEIKDPRVQGLVTVMEVDVSEDLRHASVFVSVLGGEPERHKALKGLTRASGFIRKTLGRRLYLKRIPELNFKLDTRIDEQERITRLLEKAGIGHKPPAGSKE